MAVEKRLWCVKREPEAINSIESRRRIPAIILALSVSSRGILASLAAFIYITMSRRSISSSSMAAYYIRKADNIAVTAWVLAFFCIDGTGSREAASYSGEA